MKSLEQKIIVRCKNCGWRIFDKVTMTTGVIELKCPNCHRVVAGRIHSYQHIRSTDYYEN